MREYFPQQTFCCENRMITILVVFLPVRRSLKLKLLKEENKPSMRDSGCAEKTTKRALSGYLARAAQPAQVRPSFSGPSHDSLLLWLELVCPEK